MYQFLDEGKIALKKLAYHRNDRINETKPMRTTTHSLTPTFYNTD